MFRTAVAVFASAALISGAYAADLGAGSEKGAAYVPASPWAGFYVGVNGGYGWSGTDSTVYAEAIYGLNLVNPTAATSALQSYQKNGAFGGGQIGYNFQRGQFVYGVEADIQDAGIRGSGSASVTANDTASGTSVSSNTYRNSGMDWFGTVRGRLGYAVGNTLIYGTGGFAYGGFSGKASTTMSWQVQGYLPGSQTYSVDTGATRTGYAVGAGVEHALTPQWSVKAEYQFLDFGSSEGYAGLHAYLFNPVNISQPAEIRSRGYYGVEQNFNTVRVGLNYKLQDIEEPLK
jgi:outer membrane immunogenic protein